MERTGPEPDGNRWTGYDWCLAGWQGLATDPSIRFEVEHVDGDRAVIRWRVTGAQNYRGVNLMRVRDGLNARTRSPTGPSSGIGTRRA